MIKEVAAQHISIFILIKITFYALYVFYVIFG